jgi:LacI family transcriptional regulator
MHLSVKHNYEILLTSIENDFGQLQTAARRMIERRVEGVAILTFGPDEPLIDVFKNHKLPVFTLDSQASGGLLKTVAIDYQHGIREAVQHLAASGHQEIAFVSGPKGLKTADRRRIAFQSCIHELGLPAPRQWFLEGDHTMEAGDESHDDSRADATSAVSCRLLE